MVCCQIDCFSSIKLAENRLVVVTTRLLPRVLATVATTGSLIPLFANAVFMAFRVASGENPVVLFDPTRISRLDVSLALGSRLDLAGFGLFPTTVHSCCWVGMVLVPKAATSE
jgi:hypothetical protein